MGGLGLVPQFMKYIFRDTNLENTLFNVERYIGGFKYLLIIGKTMRVPKFPYFFLAGERFRDRVNHSLFVLHNNFVPHYPCREPRSAGRIRKVFL